MQHTWQVSFCNGGSEDGENESAEGDDSTVPGAVGADLGVNTGSVTNLPCDLEYTIFPPSLGFLISKMKTFLPIS